MTRYDSPTRTAIPGDRFLFSLSFLTLSLSPPQQVGQATCVRAHVQTWSRTVLCCFRAHLRVRVHRSVDGRQYRKSIRKWGGGEDGGGCWPGGAFPNKLLSKQLNHIPNQRRIAGKKESKSCLFAPHITDTFSHVDRADLLESCCNAPPLSRCAPPPLSLCKLCLNAKFPDQCFFIQPPPHVLWMPPRQ